LIFVSEGGTAMSLVKWNPTKELLNIEREFNRLFNSLGDKFNIFRKPGYDQELDNTAWMPLADLSEDKDSYSIKLDIPGINKDDIRVSITDGVITIGGERKEEKEKKDETFHTIERSFGKFYRTFRLPVPVQENRINAVYKDGQLLLTIPKDEESKPKQIEVTVN
jgi:HSP20 family protein